MQGCIRKNKATLTLNKPAYSGMCILELSEVLMYELHYDYIKNKYGNKSKLLLLFKDTDSLMYEIKTEDLYENFSNNKEMFLTIPLSQNKYQNDSNKLVVVKMKIETAGVAVEEFVGLKLKMYLYLVDDNSEHEKVKGVNKNVIVTISHNEYKDILLNKK